VPGSLPKTESNGKRNNIIQHCGAKINNIFFGEVNAEKTLDSFHRLWENNCEDFGAVPESNFTKPPETRRGRERPRRGERGFCKNL
jgi:hypothetical protein